MQQVIQLHFQMRDILLEEISIQSTLQEMGLEWSLITGLT